MTAFVESFATRQLLPPWISKGCKTWGFAVRVSKANTGWYLNNYFNGEYPDRAPYDYAPLAGPQFGLITVSQHSRIFSHFPDLPPRDTLRYCEVYWTFPARRHRVTPDNLLVDPQIVWLQPFSFSDNSTVVFSSREIWGADMVAATVVPQVGLGLDELHVDVAIDGIEKFSPRSVSEKLACMHIRKVPGGQVELPDLLAARPELTDFIRLITAGADSGVRQRPEMVGPGGTPGDAELNNLKQLRDVEDWNAATYRAIVASRTVHAGVRDLVFYDGGRTEIDLMLSDSVLDMFGKFFGVEGPMAMGAPPEHTASGSAADSLGIHWDLGRAPLKVELAYSFSSDLWFNVDRTLHTYGG